MLWLGWAPCPGTGKYVSLNFISAYGNCMVDHMSREETPEGLLGYHFVILSTSFISDIFEDLWDWEMAGCAAMLNLEGMAEFYRAC